MIKAPKNGIRLGGKNYPAGSRVPEKYRRQLEPSSRPRDPASGSRDVPPNLGRLPLPQVITYSGMVSSLSKAYRASDEALRHSVQNAHAMLNDPVIMGPLSARWNMVSLLNWSIESEDDKDKELKAVADELKRIVSRTPYFKEYRRVLSEAIWYGRYAIQNAIGFHTNRFRVKRRVVRKWLPVSGDKLLFRYDDGSGDYDPDQIGIKVTPALGRVDKIAGDRKLEATGEGMGYFLEPWERRQFTVHKHMIRDGEYEDPISGGQIHGVGLRHFLYWVWYQKQETLAQIAELIERTGMGFTIYYYPSGNPEARAQVEKVSREQAHTNVILMPSEPGEPDAYSVQQIPPNTAGLQVLHDVVDMFFGDMIVRFILGQTLSSKPSGTGMNSGVSELQKDTLFQIARSDAVNLEESLTRELVLPLRDFNFNKYRNVDFFFRISTKVAAPQEELDACYKLWQMGAEIKVADIFDRLDLSMPDKGDRKLFNPQIVQQIRAIQQAEAAGGQVLDPNGHPGGQPDGQLPEQDDPQAGQEQQDAADNSGGQPGAAEQLDKSDPDGEEKRRLFGPVLYRKEIDDRIAKAIEETETAPTELQKEAGNYRKGKFWVRGLEIAIENPKGSKRRPEWKPLACHYGYISRHSDGGSVASPDGKDGDKVDVYLGPDTDSEIVFVIDQPTKAGGFDEHKCVLFARSTEQARELYLANYQNGWKCGPVTALTWEQFRSWLEDGDTTKPIAKQALKYAKQLGLFDESEHPRGDDGQFVEKDVGSKSVAKSATIGDENVPLEETQHESRFQVGDEVQFKNPNADEVGKTWEITEWNGDRGFAIQKGSQLAIPPVNLLRADDIEKSKSVKSKSEAATKGAKRTRSSVHFDNPIVGPSGAALTAYDWQWMWEEGPEHDDPVRVSDWSEAATNEHTGRDIVHHFHVSHHGEPKIVSLESALKILGFDDGSEGMAKVKTLAMASMQLAQQRQEHAQLENVPDDQRGPNHPYAVKRSAEKISQLEKRVKALTKEAAQAAGGTSPAKHHRDTFKRAMKLRDLFHTDENGGKRQQSQIFDIAKQSAGKTNRKTGQKIWHDEREKIRTEGENAYRALMRATRHNLLGEQTSKTPVPEDIPERVVWGQKVKAVPAWSDAKMRNWYLEHGDDVDAAIEQSRQWLEQYHPKFDEESIKYSKGTPDRYCNCETPDRYAVSEGSGDTGDKWIPYTGPKGGKGWQNIETLEVFYGEEKPGSGDKKPADAGSSPKPAQQTELKLTGEPSQHDWIPAGPNKWRHPKTGETVVSKDPPSHASTADVISKARGKPAAPPSGESPASDPRSQPGGPPKKSKLAQQLDSAPDGTDLLGWTKETIHGNPMWTKGNAAMTSRDFAAKHREQLQGAAIAGPDATDPARPSPRQGGSTGKASTRSFADHERSDVEAVSGMFGIAPGDIGSDKNMRTFLLRTARNVGFNSESVQGDRTDKAVAAAKYLRDQKPKLDAIMAMAKSYGWGGGSGREVAHSARHAGIHLFRTAKQMGYTPQGNSEPEYVAGAISFLAHHQSQRGQQPQAGQNAAQTVHQILQHLSQNAGGIRITPKHLALAAVGFYIGYMFMRRMKQRRRRWL